ncbi:MAG: N-acetyl-gamma-glutamyl-phosphate reductase [Deltaproteobacteria bacterium]|nr:N-acetyl-gamma-glutamyl-phosphate reductase [Deltaproteobacteria bacterium]
MIRVAIVGATGYTGAELLRLLLSHPEVEVTHLAAHGRAGMRLSEALPSLSGLLDLPLEPFDAARVAEAADVAFCGLPHGASAPAVSALLEAGLKVLDLSADFRLRDPAVYEAWYGAHPHTELCARSVYGLPELHREAIAAARLIAVPGCYPTSAILCLAPLLANRLIEPKSIVIDSKSGVSGAGRTPSPTTHLPETAEGIRAYKVAGTHRHTPEIEQELSSVAGEPITVTFTPHLAPMTRGILTTAYATPRAEALGGLADGACQDLARSFFSGSPSVRVLDPGRLPDTLFVRGSNFAHLAYAVDRRASRILAFAAIDNLVKGAAGQAVQCLNLMFGLPEGTGLGGAPMFP